MAQSHLGRADEAVTSARTTSVIRTGLSAVYPVRPGVDDQYGWLFEPGYPPSWDAFGRMRGALTVELCLALPKGRTLEVAAGGGGLTAALVRAGHEVVVNDLRELELRAALERYDVEMDRVSVVGGNVFELQPETLGTFDLVIACEVIEHVAHPDQLLSHLARFVAPGGRIVLTTPNGTFFRNALPTFDEVPDPDALEAGQFKPDADGHLFLLTDDELARMTAGAGLATESMFVWATPFLTGHAGLRRLAGRRSVAVARAAEWLVQRLPIFIRRRLCYSLVATMVKANTD